MQKTSGKGKSLTSKSYHAYPHDNELCAIDTLKECILRTSDFRNDRDCNQFLLGVITQHKPVVPSTISGWARKVPSNAGVNTSIFKAHSTRSASTSSSSAFAISISDIIKRGLWGNASKWETFCKKGS